MRTDAEFWDDVVIAATHAGDKCPELSAARLLDMRQKLHAKWITAYETAMIKAGGTTLPSGFKAEEFTKRG